MKKIEYLKLAISQKLFAKKAWMISAFAVIKDSNPEKYLGKLISQPWGMCMLDSEGNEVKIEDSKAGEPLFSFKDKIMLDSTWGENISSPIESTVGSLLFNHICILSSFGKKFPFVNGKVSVGKIEEMVAPNLNDTPKTEQERSNQKYYVDEYLKFVDSLQYISMFSQIATWSVTRKSILPPPGVDEFKKKLIDKYGESLSDPVQLAKFEAELLAYDDEYLKDDPAYGKFISGKMKNTARKKMHLTIGSEAGFDEGLKVVPVTNSLNQGWPTSPKEFTASMNGIRSGSFSRGAETVNGGVSAKYLLRAANNFKIVDNDCETKLGLKRKFSKDNINQLEGRYILEGSRSLLITKDNCNSYIDKDIVVRSPMYCRTQGDALCSICTGTKLAVYKTGLTIPLTEISAIILSSSLKKMHTSGTQTAKLDIHNSFT